MWSGKAPKKGQLPQNICKFWKKAGHRMKDRVEFLKWLHKKGISFREGWTKLELQTAWVLSFQAIKRLSLCNK
jgi:hypothetical protein